MLIGIAAGAVVGVVTPDGSPDADGSVTNEGSPGVDGGAPTVGCSRIGSSSGPSRGASNSKGLIRGVIMPKRSTRRSTLSAKALGGSPRIFAATVW